MGGRGFAEVDKGTTTKVPLALFRALIVRITPGRHFRISIPSDGSKLTHHTSSRRIATPSGLFLTASETRNNSQTDSGPNTEQKRPLFPCRGWLVCQIVAVVFVGQCARMGRAFQTEAARTCLQKIHLGQYAAAHVPVVATAVDI